MSTCNIDHSKDDVYNKLVNQKQFLPAELFEAANIFLDKETTQQELNELFHLLKKYDLATSEEQEKRNHAIQELVQR
ncbi:hypothetical protein ACLM5H_15370 [Fredinandcohnia humi]